MRVASFDFAPNEQHMLYGLLAVMFKASNALPDKGEAWVILGHKVKLKEALYSEDEVSLLKLAVEHTLAAGAKMLERLPEDNLAARVKAGVITQTYEAILERVINVKFTEREIHQEPENIRGNDEERTATEGDNLLLTSGSEAPSGGSGSGGE